MLNVPMMLVKSAFAVVVKAFAAMAGEAFMKWALFYLGELIVKSTATPHDDNFFYKMKAAYEEQENKQTDITN